METVSMKFIYTITVLLLGFYFIAKYTKKNTVLTIGNFDGVHKGHQKIIKQIVKLSRKKNLKSVVITFKPHPNDFLNTFLILNLT